MLRSIRQWVTGGGGEIMLGFASVFLFWPCFIFPPVPKDACFAKGPAEMLVDCGSQRIPDLFITIKSA